MNKIASLLCAALAPCLCFAQSAAPKQHAGFQVHKIETRNSAIGIEDANFVTVSPATTSERVRQHRYQISSNGQIGDFSALNWKQPKDQSYLILPVRNDVRFNTGTPGQLDVTSASGLIFRFRSGLLSAITDELGGQPCDVTFTKNAGLTQPDFRIASCTGRIVFDSGIGTSNGAYANLNGTTRVSDSQGRSCNVQNSTLYERLQGRNTTADVRLKSQSRIYQALRRLPDCARLDLGPLAPSRIGADFLDGAGSK